MTSPTDALIARINELRPIIDKATGRVGVQVRGLLVDGTMQEIKASVKPYTDRER